MLYTYDFSYSHTSPACVRQSTIRSSLSMPGRGFVSSSKRRIHIVFPVNKSFSMSINTKKVVITVVKIIVYILLVLLALAYAMKVGYFLHGFLRGGESFGVPYFIIFFIVLSFAMFTKRKVRYYLIGLLVIYSLAVVGFTEYMDFARDGQSTTSVWYKQMYKEGGIDVVYNWFLLGWLAVSLIYYIAIFFYLKKKKDKQLNGSKEKIEE